MLFKDSVIQLSPPDREDKPCDLFSDDPSHERLYRGGQQLTGFALSVTDSATPQIKFFYKRHGKIGWRSDLICPELHSSRTGDETCFLQIRKWLRTCTLEHQTCGKPISGNNGDTQWLPRLVISLSELSGTRNIKYATLSNRWIQGTTAKLLRSNLWLLGERNEPWNLPPVFREAIDSVHRLGLKYIRIDAICFFRDDPEDWAMEASMMESVYECSYCNIGASAAVDRQVFDPFTQGSDQDEDSDQDEGLDQNEGSNQNESSDQSKGSGLSTSRKPSDYSMAHIRIIR
jgi:hypothetical protein